MASVCPRLAARPPSWAMSGKIWPGLMKSSAVELKSAKALIVLARSFALMPVVISCLASTVTVNAVRFVS